MSEQTTEVAAPARAEVFSFGDPVPVLDGRDILDYIEAANMGKWYETPISFEGLARSERATPHHSSPMQLKRNVLMSTFEPTKFMGRASFERLAHEYIVFGNCYPERVQSRTGKLIEVKAAPAKYVRRGTDLTSYFFVRGYQQEYEFPRGTLGHVMQPDINQEIYGLPEYLAALSAAWLNESATLFRRRYYLNGSHAGFILYWTDPAQNQEDVDDLREKIKAAKGPGNFRNLFIYSPNGKEKGLQLIPVGEVAAKDDFLNIKNVSRDDLLAAHRVPPQLMSILPTSTGGFGNVRDAAEVFFLNEIEPLQARMLQINEWCGEEAVKFKPYRLAQQPGGPMLK
jgi:PBSX family phage portal protein